MDDTIGTQSVGEMTLSSAIQDLQKVSWKLNGLVFGESTAPGNVAKEPVPADKLTQARNSIMDATRRLREVADRLEIIGK